MSPVRDRCIVLGVTGSIAAYKAAEVCRLLVGEGAHVVPVLTESAQKMIGEATFTALASEPAVTSLWDDSPTAIPHTSLGQRASAIVVAPATARLIADLRTGRSGDALTATLLASTAPVIVAPAMHTEMWEQPSVQDNIATLIERGVTIVGPVDGPLAGGDIGAGRMADPAEVVDAVSAALTPQSMAGRRVLVTSGGTREPIDAVRFVGNRSSGKQGTAVADAAAARGAEVVLVTTEPSAVVSGVRVVPVETAAEMAAVVELEAHGADAVIMSAAVADFRPANPVGGKLKKGQGVPTLELEPTSDILASLGASKPPGQVLVGFAAETEDLQANALAKLHSKNLSMIVANDVSKEHVGFGHDTNEVVIYSSDGTHRHVPLTTKQQTACVLLDAVETLLTVSDAPETAMVEGSQ